MSPAELQARRVPREREAAEFLDLLASNLLRLGVRGRIQRVDISRKGELAVQVAVGGQQQWLGAGPVLSTESDGPGPSNEVHELKASDDHRIPLSRQLTTPESAPGMTVLSYLPHRRLVILDSRGAESAVLKGYRKGKGAASAEKYALASQAGISGRFFIPEPTRYHALHDYITIPFIEGRPFQVSAERSEDFEELGRGIGELQSIGDPVARLSRFRRQDELEVIDERARRMRLVGCAIPEGWVDLRSRLDAIGRSLSSHEAVPAHRDLHDGQLLCAAQGIALLDFDLFCRAEPELDPANFLAHLYLRKLQMPHRVTDHCVEVCGKKFLDGLDAYGRDGFWERLRFYQATTFCRLQLVYSLRPKWTGIVPSLGRLGHRCLDDLQHLAA